MLRAADEGRLPFEVKASSVTMHKAIAELERGRKSIVPPSMGF